MKLDMGQYLHKFKNQEIQEIYSDCYIQRVPLSDNLSTYEFL